MFLLEVLCFKIASGLLQRSEAISRKFYNKGVPKNFANITENPCAGFFLNNVADLEPLILLKKGLRNFRTPFYRTPPGNRF